MTLGEIINEVFSDARRRLTMSYSDQIDSDGRHWTGSWYVITTEGDLILCASEGEVIGVCAARGIVEKYGYAQHLVRGYE